MSFQAEADKAIEAAYNIGMNVSLYGDESCDSDHVWYSEDDMAELANDMAAFHVKKLAEADVDKVITSTHAGLKEAIRLLQEANEQGLNNMFTMDGAIGVLQDIIGE